jgi:Zn-dependent M28 family amino/carboxypeptidase
MLWIQERDGATEQKPEPEHATREEVTLRRWVEHLAVPRHLFANAQNNRWVREELATALERLGLSVELQGRYQNVVALPSGVRGPTTLVAAHYDSVPDCPGADDNASGLSVMLEVARLLAGGRRALRVGFVAFNAEEDGLLGSRDFVAERLPALRKDLRTIHVLEMVGFRATSPQELPLPRALARLTLGRGPARGLDVADYIALVAKGSSNAILDDLLATGAAPRLRVRAAKTWGPLHRLLPDITRSDHFPFWAAGLPAVLWTDTGNFRNPHYHRATDTPETLDYGFMRDVAELLYAIVRSSSDGPPCRR